MPFPGLPVVLAAAVLLVLAACPSSISADDTGTNFFLKASKSVPRIGRRSEYDIYLKTPKNVPRIGRRREMSPLVSNKSVACGDGDGCSGLGIWCCLVSGGAYWSGGDWDLESDRYGPKQQRRKEGKNETLSHAVVTH